MDLGMICHTPLLKKNSEARESATTNPQSHSICDMHIEWDGSEDGYWHFPLSWPYMGIIMNIVSTVKPLYTGMYCLGKVTTDFHAEIEGYFRICASKHSLRALDQ